ISQWLTVEQHTQNVCQKLEGLIPSSGLTDSEAKVLRLAARLHDWGKAHAAFQAKLKPDMLATTEVQERLAGHPAGKAPNGKSPTTGKVDEAKNAWRKDKLRPQDGETEDRRRPGFRHELASALAILEALRSCRPDQTAFAWPDGLNAGD